MNSIFLFSGGKDSFFALQNTINRQMEIKYIISLSNNSGYTQFHAGPESSAELRMEQLKALNLPFIEINVEDGKNYLKILYDNLNNIVNQDNITHLITGDLWHPFTSGICTMLAGALGISLIRPGKDICFSKENSEIYMNELIKSGIESIISSVRPNILSKNYIGRKINKELIKELKSINVDITGEGAEYQSIVLYSPIMDRQIVIDDFEVQIVRGKKYNEELYQMKISQFHTCRK